MPEVLSQSQIDALLNSMNSGGAGQAPAEEEPQEKKYRKYDFSSPRKFTKDRLKMLNSIFDNYSRVLTTRINGLVHATCEISVESVEEQRYFEFSNALSDSAVLTTAHLILKEEMEDTPVLFYASAPIMVSMMDRMTGGNGDVDSPRAAKALLEQTGCDGVMIGRAAQGNPWIFRDTVAFLETGSVPEPPDRQKKKRMVLEHADLQLRTKGEYTGVREMRKHLAWYTAGMPHSARFRQTINSMETFGELIAGVETIFG